MPLLKGSSKDIVSENIREMRNAGHSEAQSVAAALRSAGKMRKPKAKPVRKMHEIANAMDNDGNMETIEPNEPGQKPLKFKKGGLHASTGTAPGKKIPASKHAAAASGKLGPKAKKQEQFYRNVLK